MKCTWPGCRYETPEGKQYCFLHGRNAPKEEKIQDQIDTIKKATDRAAKSKESALKFLSDAGIIEKKEAKKTKPIAKKSDKRKVEDKELKKITKLMLEENDKCEMNLPGCTGTAIELHHMKKRSPATITDKLYLKRSCRSCNSYAEQFPLQAIDLGASFSKFTKDILPVCL